MAKYYGKIGYATTVVGKPGVHKHQFTERTVYGDTIKNSRKLDNSEYLLDNVSISMKISFIADPYAVQNFHNIKYATYNRSNWEVVLVEPEFPRLVLTLGGVFNEK